MRASWVVRHGKNHRIVLAKKQLIAYEARSHQRTRIVKGRERWRESNHLVGTGLGGLGSLNSGVDLGRTKKAEEVSKAERGGSRGRQRND
jgi:hypothetical protein